jgi:protein-disulfide isomerase
LVDDVLKAFPNDVNFVYKNYPLPFHPNAMPAAKAALAAGKQGKFWQMHDGIFQNNSQLGPEKFKEIAGQIGLDVARWEKDLASPEVQQQIDQEMQQARAAEVNGTPTYFINGKRFLGQRTVDGLKDTINELLKPKS